MPNPIFYAICLLAVCLPILSVQIPRTNLFSRLCSNRSEKRPPVFTKATKATTISKNPSSSSPTSKPRPQPKSSPLPAEFAQWRTKTVQSSTSFDGTHSGAESTEEDEQIVSAVRKPWDPPFPKGGSVQGGERRRFASNKPTTWTADIRDACSRTGSFPQNVDGESKVECSGPAVSSISSGKSEVDVSDHSERGMRSKTVLFLWCGAIAIAVLLFLLAFAILIAHCLAWFLVYKTEARLGEARRGIMTSGDMRLCLCAA